MAQQQLCLSNQRGEYLAAYDAGQLRQAWSYLPHMAGRDALAVIVEIEARERFAGLRLRKLARWESLERTA